MSVTVVHHSVGRHMEQNWIDNKLSDLDTDEGFITKKENAIEDSNAKLREMQVTLLSMPQGPERSALKESINEMDDAIEERTEEVRKLRLQQKMKRGESVALDDGMSNDFFGLEADGDDIDDDGIVKEKTKKKMVPSTSAEEGDTMEDAQKEGLNTEKSDEALAAGIQQEEEAEKVDTPLDAMEAETKKMNKQLQEMQKELLMKEQGPERTAMKSEIDDFNKQVAEMASKTVQASSRRKRSTKSTAVMDMFDDDLPAPSEPQTLMDLQNENIELKAQLDAAKTVPQASSEKESNSKGMQRMQENIREEVEQNFELQKKLGLKDTELDQVRAEAAAAEEKEQKVTHSLIAQP